ncbi:MAG: sodium ion-translocating decarboxylase subunit beta, partial [Vicinamibacterales bacterium]
PPLMRLLTTRTERRIRMEYAPRPVPRAAVIAFPIIVTVVVGVVVPASAPLVATLMFGNLLKESGVVPQLSNAASNELANISTLFLGLTIGSLMQAATFLQTQTLFILLLGLIAFVLDTVAGLLFGKVLAVVTRGKINPLVGAAGISAFPMSGRLVQKVAQEEDFTNHVLMHAMGANTAGQLGSVIAGGVLLTLVELLGGG